MLSVCRRRTSISPALTVHRTGVACLKSGNRAKSGDSVSTGIQSTVGAGAPSVSSRTMSKLPTVAIVFGDPALRGTNTA